MLFFLSGFYRPPADYLSVKKIPTLLIHAKHSSAPLLGGLLLLLAALKGSSINMITTNVVKVLDFVDTDDPVLAGISLLNRVDNRSLVWDSNLSDSISGLSRRKQRAVVVIRQLVPKSGISI